MNEQIKELAEQADILWMLEHYPKLEKFAELIVRECAAVAGKDVRHFVLEHFGLKECGK